MDEKQFPSSSSTPIPSSQSNLTPWTKSNFLAVLLLMSCGVMVGALPLTGAGLRWEELAATGQVVPDFPAGGTFTTFRDQPLIGHGRVLYRGQMSTPSGTVDGFWYRNDGTGADVLAMAGKELPLGAPVGSSLFSATFSQVAYGPNAAVAASAYLTGGPVTSANDRVWLAPEFPASGARIRAQEGDAAGIGDWKLERWSSSLPAVNAYSDASFSADFIGSGTNASNEDNIWTTSGWSHHLVRQGYQNDSVPGYSADEYFVWFGGAQLAMNASGVTAYFAATYNRSSGLQTRRLLLRGGGVNREVTNATVTPPGFPASSKFRLTQDGPVRMTSGTNPHVVFADGSGIWRWHDGTMERVVASGEQTTTPSGLYLSPTISKFAVSSFGQVAFLASLSGPGITTANNQAIVLENHAGPETLVVRYQKGDHLPGMPAGSVVTGFQAPSLSDGERLAFVATYNDNGTSRTGLWLEGSGLWHVCSTGDLRRGSDGVIREISYFQFRAGGHSASPTPLAATAPCGWDDETDTVVLRVGYTDGSQAVWKVEVEVDLTPVEMLDDVTLAAGLSGDDALPLAEPFNDGVPNLLKYAFNMNLGGPDPSTMSPGGAGGLPSFSVDDSGPQTTLRVEFVRRKESGLVYTPKRSTTLDPDSFAPMTGGVTVVAIDDEFERVVVREPCDPAVVPRCFGYVEVEFP